MVVLDWYILFISSCPAPKSFWTKTACCYCRLPVSWYISSVSIDLHQYHFLSHLNGGAAAVV